MTGVTVVHEHGSARQYARWVAIYPKPYGSHHATLPLSTRDVDEAEALAYAVEHAATLSPDKPLRLARVNGKLVAL